MNYKTYLLMVALGAAMLLGFWPAGTEAELEPTHAFLVVVGVALVIAGLIGVKRSDDAFAKHVVFNEDPTPPTQADSMWTGLLRSVKELFVGPGK
ncbi:TPA: hypothetical protein ACWLUJ_005760 [Pseudomonas aeruginosa]|nr:hypothetical protein [Pseudomonas aeruginosa]